MMDWLAWHTPYEDPDSSLSRRLTIVRMLLGEAVATNPDDELRVLSLCAGDGRDLLPVLALWRDRKRIRGRLIEIEPMLANRAQDSMIREGFSEIETVCGDAGQSASYVGAFPADLVVACGVFGNISDGDIHRLICAMPMICAERGSVIWTRHRRLPDLTPTIRAWFTAAGFEERAFVSPGLDQFSVGWHQLVEPASSARLPESLFEFVERPASRCV